MRTLIRAALMADENLAALGFVPSAILAGDVDTPKERPFIQLRWGVNNLGMSVVTRRFLVVWVHDEPGDYARIDRTLLAIRALLTGMVGQAHTYGHLMVCEWTGDSEDLTDPGHGTITRTASFSLVGTGQ